MIDARRQRFAPHVRRLADMMGLKDWQIRILDVAPEECDHEAAIYLTYGRKLATIALADTFLDQPEEKQRVTLTHELVHCHVEQAWKAATDHLDPSLHPTFIRSCEYAIDGIAQAWAQTLPPIDEGRASNPTEPEDDEPEERPHRRTPRSRLPTPDANGHFKSGRTARHS